MLRILISLTFILIMAAPAYSATSVTYEGSSYSIPETNEENWSGTDKVDGFLVALGQNVLQKTGGNWTLSSELDFGTTAGLLALYWGSTNANPSSSGIFRLANAESVGWRNAANDGNLLLSVNSSNELTFNGVSIATSSGLVPVTAGGTGLSSYTAGDLLYASSDPSVLSKLAIGSTDQALTISGGLPSWGTLAVAGGGTGSVTAAGAYDTLAQTTTKGDLTVRDSSGANRLAVGTDGQVLQADSTESLGVKWAAAPTSDGPMVIENVGVSTSVGSNILTVTLVQSDGTSAPDSSNPAKIGFRSTTATNGGYNVRSITSTKTVTVSSGSTLGFIDGNTEYAYVYAIDNGGTVELAVSANRLHDESGLQSTTAEGGAGGADSRATLYSLDARTSVPIRLIGTLEFSLTTAGTWNEAGDVLSVGEPKYGSVSTYDNGGITVVSAYIVNGGSPSVSQETGDWITSLTDNSTGDTNINVRSGVFENGPMCNCTVVDQMANNNVRVCVVYPTPSTSTIRILTNSGANHGGATDPAPIDNNFYIECKAEK